MSWSVTIDHPRPGEKVELVIRRHWIVYVILGLFFCVWVFASLWTLIMFSFTSYVNLIVIIFWMFFSMFLYIEWLNHELDLFIITNNRIIWVDQISFLNRTVSECTLWQVQEVWSQTKWFFANILNYWSIVIQTAWNTSNFSMDLAPNAIESSSILHNLVDHYRDTNGWVKPPEVLKKA